MTKKEKEYRYKQKWHKNRSMIYRKTFKRTLERKRTLEYKSKLKDYSVFLKEDLESFHYSILQMLRFKLSRNYHYLIQHQIRLDFDIKKLKSMKDTIELLEKVEKSDFGETAAIKNLTKKWKTIRILYADRLPAKLLKKSNMEFQKITMDCHKKRKAALARAFSLITENIWNWWDEEYPGDETALLGKVEFLPKR